MERLRVGGHYGRHDADVTGQWRDPRGDEDGVQASADPVGAAVRFRGRGGLEAERVLDGHEVEQTVLGLGDQIGPVGGGEQFTGAGDRFAPGGRVPAGAVEGDGEVQGERDEDTGGAFLIGRTRNPAPASGAGLRGDGSGATERAGDPLQIDVQ